MKNILIISLMTLVSTLISSCDKNNTEKINSTEQKEIKIPVKNESTENKVSLSEEHKTFMQAYEELHQSFFEFDKAKVTASAMKLVSLAKNIQDEKLKSKLISAVESLKSIENSMDREKMNEQFHLFTKKLMSFDGEHNFSSEYSVYYCPMVKKSWLQSTSKSDEVRNPYDSSMPKCGVKKS